MTGIIIVSVSILKLDLSIFILFNRITLRHTIISLINIPSIDSYISNI